MRRLEPGQESGTAVGETENDEANNTGRRGRQLPAFGSVSDFDLNLATCGSGKGVSRLFPYQPCRGCMSRLLLSAHTLPHTCILLRLIRGCFCGSHSFWRTCTGLHAQDEEITIGDRKETKVKEATMVERFRFPGKSLLGCCSGCLPQNFYKKNRQGPQGTWDLRGKMGRNGLARGLEKAGSHK